MTRWPLARDIILFFGGFSLVINEALLRDGEPRLNLLLLYAGMMGLTAFTGRSK